jgi:predicted enzyme related to lactoylglutathione lyase
MTAEISLMTLNTLILPVADVEMLYRCKEWYLRLGLKHAPPDNPNESVWFDIGNGLSLGIHTSDSPPSTGVTVYFNVPDVDGAFSRLSEAGFIFDTPPTDKSWGGRVAYLKDPVGNSVGLVKRL